jgi:hypothetical protein
MLLPIADLEVVRYRGLKDFALKGLGRVNLLVGKNNSGKTSVLEAISLASAPFDPWGWMSVASRREPQRGRRTMIERLRWLFPQHASKGPESSYDGSIAFSIGGRSPFLRVEAKYQDLRSALEIAVSPIQPGMREETALEDDVELSTERRGARIDIEIIPRSIPGMEDILVEQEESFTWWEGERFESPRQSVPAVPTQVITPYDHWFRALPARMYSDERREGGTGAVLELLTQVDSRIVGLEVLAARSGVARVPPEAVLYLRDRNAGLLPVEAFGDGMRRILLMALAVTRARGGMLLIDEIETAIHISALGRVFRWIVESCASNEVQLVATTHSLEAIDAILAADTTPEDDIVGYRLDLNQAITRPQNCTRKPS